jgi:hypothetical protein
MTAIKASPHGAVVIDDRYAPLLVSTFMGQIELAEGQWFEETLCRLIRREYALGRRIINISDPTRTGRTKAEMRKFWAEMSARHEDEFAMRTLAHPIVVTNPVFRGVVTAIGWLNPAVAKIELFPSLEAAVEDSVQRLERAGTPVTLPTGGYRLPEEASSAQIQRLPQGA